MEETFSPPFGGDTEGVTTGCRHGFSHVLDRKGGLSSPLCSPQRGEKTIWYFLLTITLVACSQQESTEERPPAPAEENARNEEPESIPENDAQTTDPGDNAPLELRGEGLTTLPRPRIDHPATLMRALEKRRSTREFSDKQLPAQILSDLLWATAGVNRPDAGKRTAPSAWDRQEVDLYVALIDGLFLYRAKVHALEPVAPEDLRALTGKQGYVATAPVNLVYVADLSRMKGSSDQDRIVTSASDTGFMAQNAYLYCAAEGLAVVVRGWIDKEALGKAMKLRPEQRIVLAQSIGYSIR